MKRNIKLVIIGGGSSYTPELIEGIILKNESLNVKEVVLVDLPSGKEKAEIITALAKRMIAAHHLDIDLKLTYNVEEALLDADYVLNQIRVGGLFSRSTDESIPLKYGLIGQETTGAGGFFKALRTIPVVVDIAKKMELLCPKATLINFTNPSGIVTEAVIKATRIRCIGLCNVPINMKRNLAEILELDHTQVEMDFLGLNHLSFVTGFHHAGKNHLSKLLNNPDVIDEVVANISDIPVTTALLQTIKAIPSPYLSYYFFEDHMLSEELEKFKNGITRATEVMSVEKELFALYKNPELKEKPEVLSQRGGSLYSEAAISLVDSIENNLGDCHVINVLNNGIIKELPADAVIETTCKITRNRTYPILQGKLEEPILSLVQAVKAYESLTVTAVLENDISLAKKAFLIHPLVHDYSKGLALFDEMYEANKAYLNF